MANSGKCARIFETLKSEILGGRYSLQAPFPSVARMARRFNVSSMTAVKVLDKLKEGGFLRTRQGSGTFLTRHAALRKIGLIMPDVAQTEYFLRISRELMRVAERAQYELLFGEVCGASAQARAARAEALARDFVRQGVAGVIFQPIEYYDGGDDFNRRMLDRLEASRIPVVLCDNAPDPDACRHDVVGNDNIAAGARMYRHLAASGATRVCFFMRPYSAQTHVARAQGATLARLPGMTGTVCREALLVAEPDDARAVARRVAVGKVDAFMCGDDETAVALMQTLRRLGLSVPDDVLVAGFNDLNVARLLSPPLTTMRVNCEQIAGAAFARLVARIADPGLPPTAIHLPVELVVRESTARRPPEGRTTEKRGKGKGKT